MVVTFKRLVCSTCDKVRWHEIIHSPCCVACGNYNLDQEPVQLVEDEVEHFIGQ